MERNRSPIFMLAFSFNLFRCVAGDMPSLQPCRPCAKNLLRVRVCIFFLFNTQQVCAPRRPASRRLRPTSLANGFQLRFFGLSRRARKLVRGATNQALLEHRTSEGRTFYILWIDHKISRSCPVNLEGLTAD